MTPTSLLAAALQSRGAFDAIRDSDEAAVLPEELVAVWQAIERYYETDSEVRQADPEIVLAYATEGLSNPKHQQHLKRIVDVLSTTEVSAANIQEMLRMVARTRVGDLLAQALASRQPSDKVAELIRQYEEYSGQSAGLDDDADSIDWRKVLAERLDPAGRLSIAPRVLNEFLGGGLLPGQNVTLFARPEAGKTALALTIACGLARKGHRVLYIINEDSVKDLMVRALCCITKWDKPSLERDPEGAIRLGMERGLGNLYMRELAPGSLRDVEKLVKMHKPTALIVDQIRNLRAAKTDNFVQGLDHIAQGIRSIGKKYNVLTIGITQAGDSASGRPVLEMGDIDSSNTGIPGAADVLIGLGVTDQLRNAGQRVLSVCKNKVSGQHGHFSVKIDELRSRITS